MEKKITVTMPKQMYRRIEKEADSHEWKSKADYIRHLIRAGESNIADLDPRTNGSMEENDFDPEKLILDGLSGEYKEVDEALEPAVNSLATKLDEMSNEDSSSIEYHPRKGYRVSE